ncbi:hypothetical protein ABB02_01319 [Clostridiaceae bacterium JG1575]|nr:hypothetical protein ABB02_01319 [Clostridiaceae bacterium JG1575]
MTLRHLKIFLEVARTGNMSEAAAKLFLSQPTVSQAIKDLETHFGLLLFERRPKKLYITEGGQMLLREAQGVLEKMAQLEDHMNEMIAKETLRIGGTITVGNSILNPVIQEFHQKIPGVETFVCVNNTTNIETMILANELDIGIIEGQVLSPELLIIPAVNDYLVLVCNKHHPFAQKRLIPMREIEHQKFHLRERGSGTRALFENFCQRKHLKIHCVYESNCPSAIVKSIKENDNLSVMSIRLVEEEIQKGELHAIRLSGGEWTRNFSLVYHRDKQLNDAMKTMMRIVKTHHRKSLTEGLPMSILCGKLDAECAI